MKKLSAESFIHQLRLLCPDYLDKKFLLATSGGVDSMVLLHLCWQEKLSIEVAHINYHLRGEDSDNDESLVTKFCHQHDIPLHIQHANQQEKPQNIQIWARNIRYDFFHQIKTERQLDLLLTAHHLNDQMETFFINLLRGTGIRGLCGIPANENDILRPLLSFDKKSMYDYAERNKVAYREDKSNAKNLYQRNILRNEILPQLEQLNPHFLDNFLSSIQHLTEAKNSLDTYVKNLFTKISTQKDEQISLDKMAFGELENFVQYEMLRPFGMNAPTEIQKLLHAETGAIFTTETHQILINRNEIIIRTQRDRKEKHCLIEQQTNETSYTLPEQSVDFPFQNTAWIFDASKVIFPLKIRPIHNGDRFYPTGMKGSKLVSKYLKDEKINRFDKEKCVILCDASGEILGVLPYRQDRRKAKTEHHQENITIIF